MPNDTKGVSTDINGNATLKVKNSTKEFEINVSYVGFKRFSFKIKADSCMDIKVNLANSNTSEFLTYTKEDVAYLFS